MVTGSVSPSWGAVSAHRPIYMVILPSDVVGGNFTGPGTRSDAPALLLPPTPYPVFVWVPRTPEQGDRSHKHYVSGPVPCTGGAASEGKNASRAFYGIKQKTGLRRWPT